MPINHPSQSIPKRFIIYTRCSTDDQARGDFTTLDAQEHHCKCMLEALEHETVRIVRDDGYSGKDLKRPGIQSILNEIGMPNKTPSFDGIIFLRLDRLTRSNKDLFTLIDLFNKYNIQFLSVKESLDSSNAVGRLMISIIGIMASFEREVIGERVSASMLARIQQGIWPGSILPFGYKRIPSGQPLPNGRQPKKIIPDPSLIPVIRKIFQLAAENRSLQFIGQMLEKDNVKTAQNGSWRKQAILNVIRNPYYKGSPRWRGKSYAGSITPIVDADLWDKANKVMGSNLPGHRFSKKPKTYIYLLEGLLRCGCCNSSLITTFAQGHKNKEGAIQKFHYYQCSRSKLGLGCSATRIPATTFDRALLDYFKRARENKDIIIQAIGKTIEIAQKQLKITSRKITITEKTLQAAKKEASKLIDMAINGVISQGPTYKDRLEKLESDIAIQEKRLEQLNASRTAAEMAKNSNQFVHRNISLAISQMENINPETQKALMKFLIKEILVYDNNIEIRMFTDRPQEGAPLSSPPNNKKGPVSSSPKKPALYIDGSSERQNWLPRLDSNQDKQIQSLLCYRLHHEAISNLFYLIKAESKTLFF